MRVQFIEAEAVLKQIADASARTPVRVQVNGGGTLIEWLAGDEVRHEQAQHCKKRQSRKESSASNGAQEGKNAFDPTSLYSPERLSVGNRLNVLVFWRRPFD